MQASCQLNRHFRCESSVTKCSASASLGEALILLSCELGLLGWDANIFSCSLSDYGHFLAREQTALMTQNGPRLVLTLEEKTKAGLRKSK